MNRNDFRSKFEYELAKELEKNKIPFEYEPCQLDYDSPVYQGKCLDCGSKQVCSPRKYTPDFYLPEQDIYLEAKGKFVAQNRTKMLSVIESNPDLDIRMVFMRDNWLTKKKAKRYSDWCEQKGIKYCVGTSIPKGWLNER